MTYRSLSEPIEHRLRDISDQQNVCFGEKLMLFGGDFRQVLPVVTK